jgi:hypothetical protein
MFEVVTEMISPKDSRTTLRSWLLGGLAILAFASPSVIAQQPAPSSATSTEAKPASVDTTPANTTPDAAPPESLTQRRADAAMQGRKNQLAVDTAKLLQLANELKAEMDKSSKDTLSLSVIKKADEVEKLARKVRAEMKASIGN